MDNFKKIGLYIVDRLDEPSTWAGATGLWMTLGLTQGMSVQISTIGVSVFSLLAMILREKAPVVKVEK